MHDDDDDDDDDDVSAARGVHCIALHCSVATGLLPRACMCMNLFVCQTRIVCLPDKKYEYTCYNILYRTTVSIFQSVILLCNKLLPAASISTYLLFPHLYSL
jgi:hypothetical protein